MKSNNELWEQAKNRYPTGSVLTGEVFQITSFGLFIDIGYGTKLGYVPIGIIEIVSSKSQYSDTKPQPKVRQLVRCEAIFHRDNNMEIDLQLLDIVGKNE